MGLLSTRLVHLNVSPGNFVVIKIGDYTKQLRALTNFQNFQENYMGDCQLRGPIQLHLESPHEVTFEKEICTNSFFVRFYRNFLIGSL